jgi:hypothetical protein
MAALFIIFIVLGAIAFIFGIAIEALKWLIYVAIVLALIGIIGWIIRGVTNKPQ